jgi:hypothetical protein
MAATLVSSTARGSATFSHRTTLTDFVAGTPIPLFGGDIPAGVSTISIAVTDPINGAGATAAAWNGDLATLVIADTADGGAAQASVIDFAGLNYCSMNTFQGAAPASTSFLLFSSLGMDGQNQYMRLFRVANGEWAFDASVGGAGVIFDITINVQGRVMIPSQISAANFYRVIETLMVSDPNNAGTVAEPMPAWTATAPARLFNRVIRGNGVPLSAEAQAVLGPNAVTTTASGRITLAAGNTYNIKWRVPGFGVDKFQSYLEVVDGTAAIAYQDDLADGDLVVLGSPAFSASTSSSAIAYSFGEATLSVGAGGATILIAAVPQTPNPVQGRGNLNNQNSAPVLPSGAAAAGLANDVASLFTAVRRDVLSEIDIQAMSA